MVFAERKAMESILIQTLYTNDRVMLKSVLESFTYSRSMQLRNLLSGKEELGGFTPLQFACLQGNSQFASMLIDSGATDVNEKGKYGWTALHAAASSGDLKTVKLLLNSCADCFAKDENGNLPIEYVYKEGVKEALKEVMRRKNLELFEAYCCDYVKMEKNTHTKLKVNTTRSHSCFASIGRDNENNKSDNKNSSTGEETESSSDENEDEERSAANLRKWKTFSHLAITNVYSDSTLLFS